MKECSKVCLDKQTSCPNADCRHWIEYEEDYNCCLIAVDKNGSMGLREVAKRIGVSFVFVKQIQDKALVKISKSKVANKLLCILEE